MGRRLVNLLTALSLLLGPAVVGPALSADVPATARAPLATLPGPSGTDVKFSRDGKYILTAGGDQARVWDAETFKPVTGPLRHAQGRKLFLACVSPDGTSVLTVSGDQAFLWDARRGKCRLRLKHDGDIRCAAFSPAGDRIVTGGTDKTARVWDLTAGGKQALTLARGATVGFVAFSPDDGRTLLTIDGGPGESGSLRVWDSSTGRERWGSVVGVPVDIAQPLSLHPAAFSPDGKRVAWIPHATACVADASRGGHDNLQGSRDFGDRIVEGIDFSPDGNTLLVVTGYVAFLDATRRDLAGAFRLDTEGVRSAVFSADSRYVLTAARTDRSGVWDVRTGRRVLELPAHLLYDKTKRDSPHVLRQDGRPAFAYEIPAIAFSPDGKRAAAGFASDGFTGVWAVKMPEEDGARK